VSQVQVMICIRHLQVIFCFGALVMDYPLTTPQQLRPLLIGFRKAAGLTQAQLAARLGVTQQTYAQLEAKPESASLDRIYLVLKLLDVSLILTDRSGSAGNDDSVVKRVESAKQPVAMKISAKPARAGAAKTQTKRVRTRAETPPEGRANAPLPIASVIKKREKW
jgi:HTH-type transcriptional regulator / antitoxin HipB